MRGRGQVHCIDVREVGGTRIQTKYEKQRGFQFNNISNKGVQKVNFER